MNDVFEQPKPIISKPKFVLLFRFFFPSIVRICCYYVRDLQNNSKKVYFEKISSSPNQSSLYKQTKMYDIFFDRLFHHPKRHHTRDSRSTYPKKNIHNITKYESFLLFLLPINHKPTTTTITSLM